MQTPIKIITAASCLTFASGYFAAVQSADNGLGESSSGRVYITLEIGAGELSQISPGFATQLQGANSASFPICITYIDSQFVNVSVTELEQDGFSLLGASGEVIPYQISLGTSGGAQSGDAKVKAINNSACGEESALEVNVSLLPTSGQGASETISGKFNFLIKSE